MRDRADAGMRRIDLVDIGLHVSDEFLEVLGRQILLRQDQDRRPGQQRDRLEILFRMIGKVRIERHRRRMGAHMPRDQRVAVIGGARGTGGGGGAAGADHVLDDDALAQRLRHVRRDDARDDVGRTAGRERHDHGDGARRVGRRLGRSGNRAEASQSSQTTGREHATIQIHQVSPRTRLHYMPAPTGRHSIPQHRS